jgi:Rod binding domain-containing protein
MSDFKLPPPGFDAQALAQVKANNIQAKTNSKATDENGQPKGLDKAAEDFEAMFMSQMLAQMWSGVDVDPNFGGGEAEKTWRGMMIEEYGKQIAKSGGVGISNDVKSAMLELQEQANAGGKTRKGGK